MSKRVLIGAAALTTSLMLAPAAGASVTFSNPTPIVINDAVTPGVPRDATPYPSTVTVPNLAYVTPSGLQPSQIDAATVTLHGVSHTRPADIRVALVNSLGSTRLLENAGGATVPVANADLTFGRTGAFVPRAGPLVSGAFRPTAYPRLTSVPITSVTQPLSIATGDWSVYVSDQDPDNTGVIARGISVTLNRNINDAFDVGSPKLDKRKGTATVSVTVANPGVIVLRGSKTVKGVTVNAPAAGTYRLTVKSTGQALKKLKRKRKVVVRITTTYTPTAGVMSSTSDSVTLKLKAKKKKRKK